MATSQSGMGMKHPTVVPSNFERSEGRCPTCGRTLDDCDHEE